MAEASPRLAQHGTPHLFIDSAPRFNIFSNYRAHEQRVVGQVHGLRCRRRPALRNYFIVLDESALHAFSPIILRMADTGSKKRSTHWKLASHSSANRASFSRNLRPGYPCAVWLPFLLLVPVCVGCFLTAAITGLVYFLAKE